VRISTLIRPAVYVGAGPEEGRSDPGNEAPTTAPISQRCTRKHVGYGKTRKWSLTASSLERRIEQQEESVAG
jgi:hypothetical protein